MPRIYQALKLIDPNLFVAPLIISNFAIDYLPNKFLDNKKIAIVNDSINIGTTLNNTAEKIKRRFTNTHINIFTVYKSQNKHIVDAITADDSFLSLYEYQERSNYLASSLNCLSKPF